MEARVAQAERSAGRASSQSVDDLGTRVCILEGLISSGFPIVFTQAYEFLGGGQLGVVLGDVGTVHNI